MRICANPFSDECRCLAQGLLTTTNGTTGPILIVPQDFRCPDSTATPSAPPVSDAGPVVEAARQFERDYWDGTKDFGFEARLKLFDALAEYDRTNQPGAQGGERG